MNVKMIALAVDMNYLKPNPIAPEGSKQHGLVNGIISAIIQIHTSPAAVSLYEYVEKMSASDHTDAAGVLKELLECFAYPDHLRKPDASPEKQKQYDSASSVTISGWAILLGRVRDIVGTDLGPLKAEVREQLALLDPRLVNYVDWPEVESFGCRQISLYLLGLVQRAYAKTLPALEGSGSAHVHIDMGIELITAYNMITKDSDNNVPVC